MPFATQAKVDGLRLPPGKTEHWEFDQRCTGLSIRLQGRHSKTWVVWYSSPDGRRRKLKLGDVAGMRLEEARRKATEIVNGAKGGQDAVAERRAAREAAKTRTAATLGRLIGVYLERRAKPNQRPRTYLETERYLLKRWAPLHGRPGDSISRRDVAAELERIRVEHGGTAGNHARVLLSGCYSWAMKAGLADHNPVVGTEPPAPIVKRDRVLKPEELAAVWNAAGDDDFGRIVKLLTLTGQRREEVAAMAWPELDLERRIWAIPGARTKNKRPNEVPLSDQALSLLPERRPGRDLVFGRRDGPFSGFSQSKARLDQRILARRREADPAAKAMPAWRLHDLRRSAATYMHEIGVSSEVVEAILNHARPGVRGIYDRSKLGEPKRAAMQRYAAWLMGLVTGEERRNLLAFG